MRMQNCHGRETVMGRIIPNNKSRSLSLLGKEFNQEKKKVHESVDNYLVSNVRTGDGLV